MASSRPRYGLFVAALGAVLLAVAVFLPWYGISFTERGIAAAQQVGEQVSAEYGNATLQGYMSTVHAGLASLAGREILAVSAHQALKDLNVVLLILAGLGVLIALYSLAAPSPANADSSRTALALLGALAALCVAFRMIDPPSAPTGAPAGELFRLTLREGTWLALLGALAMLGGALWPSRRAGEAQGAEQNTNRMLSELSGWTPET